jgi:hypothetical protein
MVKEYLGDAVYVDLEPRLGGISLTTNNGIKDTNTIYLEYDVMQALVAYIKRNEENF